MSPTPRHTAAEVADALGLPTPTPEQQAVIEAPLESVLVVAGAGSGKTETMAGRVVWLVANGLVAPEAVLGLTFTRKAAGELAERIAGRLRRLALIGGERPEEPADPDALPTVATYHSYAGGLVREHGLRLGVEPDARLLTEAAAWQYAHEVTVRYDGPMDQVSNAESTVTAAVRDLAGQLAEHLRTPAELDDYLASVDRRLAALPQGSGRSKAMPARVRELLEHVRAQRQVLPLLEAYAATKTASESLDFADQMALAARLAQLDPGVAAAERSRYSVVLLDEFQDTSEAQMRLLHALYADPRAGRPRPVMAVGDPHQSIYGWRGASATTLAAFPARFTVPARATTRADTPAPVDNPLPADAPVLADTRVPADGTPEVSGDVEAGDGRGGGPVVPPVLPLSTSWRNDRAILEAANATAAPLSAASAVPVRPLSPRPTAEVGTVEAARLLTAADEAEAVADWIARHWWSGAGESRTASGVSAAVLCRRRAQFAAIADAVASRGIPVEVVGLGGLLTRPEVSDIVSLLRVVHDPSRGDALMRLLTGPVARLGAADIDALGAWSREDRDASVDQPGDTPTDGTGATPGDTSTSRPGGRVTDRRSDRSAPAPVDRPEPHDEPSLVEAVDALPPPEWTGRQGQRLSPVARDRLRRVSEAIATVRAAVGHPLPELVVLAERTLGLDVEVAAAVESLPQTARGHLDAFADAAADFAHGADRPTLGGFLDWLDAARDEERGLDVPAAHVAEGAVQVLTVHAAKGLEWDVVAVPGLVEAAFPSHRSFGPGQDGGPPTPSSKGWITGLGGIPYDLRGDAAGLPALPWRAAEDLTELNGMIAEFASAGGHHLLEEERRLAYVAVTRARSALLLSASVWLDGVKPRVTSRFLTELRDLPGLVTTRHWEPDPEPDAVNPALADTEATHWPLHRDDARDAAERRAAEWVLAAQRAARASLLTTDAPPDVDPPGTPFGHIEVVDVPAAAVDLAARASDDDVTGEPADMADAYAAADDAAAHDGAAGHDAAAADVEEDSAAEEEDLAQISALVDVLLAEFSAPRRGEIVAHLPGHLSTSALVELRTDPAGYAERLRRPMPAPPATAARLGTAFHAWIEGHYRSAALVDDLDLDLYDDEDPALEDLDAAKELFLASPWAQATPVEIEVSLETVVAGLPVRGRIDAVFPRSDGGVTIVDWKTGAPPAPARLAERSLQLAVYRLAYARWSGLPTERIDAAFYYAATGTTVYPELPDEEDLVRQLADLTAAEGPEGP